MRVAITGANGLVGAEAVALRHLAPGLPAAIVATLPAIRLHTVLVAVPVLGYPDRQSCAAFPVVFAPVAGDMAGGADWRGLAAHYLPGLPPYI